MDIAQIKSQLSSAKAAVNKNDLAGSLKRFIYALHALVKNENIPTDIRSLIRDIATEYNSFTAIKEELKINFTYTVGEEKKLLVVCMKAYEHLTKNAEEQESYEDALIRKKNIDTNLIAAKDFLARGFVEQADAAVEKALESYKDEHAIFAYIGKLYLDSNFTTRAKHFYKKAVEAEPENQAVASKYIEVSKMK